MARQMIDYCSHELFRIFQRVAEYEAQQRGAQWRELEPLDRTAHTVGVLGLGELGGRSRPGSRPPATGCWGTPARPGASTASNACTATRDCGHSCRARTC